jgi:NAD(P)-dependent dehydrogenase (short-subunit alcohol dehydrogenase family)
MDVPHIDSLPYALSSREDLMETVKLVEKTGARIIAVEGDVRDQSALDGLVARGLEEFGHIDIAVANAGIWTVAPFAQIPDEDWQLMHDVNVMGTVRTIRSVTPHMMETQRGSIVIISSVNGLEAGYHYAHYTASKHALLGIMKNVALEYGPHGIRCNAVLPGAMDTPINDWQGGYDLYAGGPGIGTPLHRQTASRAYPVIKDMSLLPPESTSRAVLYLASDDAACVTGTELIVDGGHNIIPGLNVAGMMRGQEEYAQLSAQQ